MRRMKGLAAIKQALFDGQRGWRAEQDFQDGGSVDDDHRKLRSSRSTRAGFRAGETGLQGRRAPGSKAVPAALALGSRALADGGEKFPIMQFDAIHADVILTCDEDHSVRRLRPIPKRGISPPVERTR